MDDESVGFREVLRELCVDEEDCLALYHTGSRAYGTASKSSDWDFVMVVRDETKARYTGDTETDYLEQGLFSTTIYEQTAFQQLLTSHNHLAVYCICSPKNLVWCEKVRFETTFSLPMLFAAFSRKVGSCFSKARSYNKKGDYVSMKKMIVHGLRYLLVAQQLVKKGDFCPVDFAVANGHHHEIMGLEETAWPYYEEKHLKYRLMCQIFPTLCGKQVQETRVASASKEESLWEQLKQLSVYSEGFEDRKFNSILDAIRLNLASEESIVERFPSLVDSWKQTQLQYQLLCCGIQKTYNDVRSQFTDEEWDRDSGKLSKVVNTDGGKWKCIIFSMHKLKCEDVTTLFAIDDYRKLVQVAMKKEREKGEHAKKRVEAEGGTAIR